MTSAEHILTGTGVGRGLVVGSVRRMPDPLPEPPLTPSTLTPAAELTRATAALSATAEDLRERGLAAGGVAKEVLDALALMADDTMLLNNVTTRIDGGGTAERSVFEAFAEFAAMMESAGGYMAVVTSEARILGGLPRRRGAGSDWCTCRAAALSGSRSAWRRRR